MKIGLLSQWFDPEPGPAAIPGVLARELIRGGHEVSVLTGYPNYPAGKIFPGYDGRRRSVTRENGLLLTRVPLFASHDRSSVGRISNYASFALSASLLGRPSMKDVEGIWVYNSPITVGLPLLIHSRGGRVPIFLQVQDLWPDSLIDSGMFPGGLAGRAASSLISSIVRVMENRAAVIGVSSEGARQLILDRNPRLNPDRIVHSPNSTDQELFRPIGEIEPHEIPNVSWREEFTAMYVGAVGDVQGLDSVVEAAAILREHAGIRFVVVGDGIAKEGLAASAIARGLTNITFVGRIEKTQVPGYMATASVQLVTLAKRKFLEYTTPSKIASLLASGVPIIGQLPGDGARLIAASGAGILAIPESGESLADAVLQMKGLSHCERSEMGASGRRYYERELSASAVASRVATSLADFAG